MRVTNNMMRNNSLLHIQRNKSAYNTYFEQYATQKKIQKPSDDPTIAVRALKYRTTMVEIEQYLKNCDDAENWLDATEKPLDTVNNILDTMIENVTNAANDPNNADDRATIAQQLREYAGFIYEQNANADYAGRYLYTGFRTDVPLLFSAAQTDTTYTITEDLKVNDIKASKYVYGQPVYDPSSNADDYAKSASQFLETHKISISYNNCDKEDVTITYKDKDGVQHTVTAVTKSIPGNNDYNEHYKPDDDVIYFVPESGELVFGATIYDSVRAGSDLSVVYKKTHFKENDIRPEHYFDCIAANTATGVTRNYTDVRSQKINYQINFSQTLTVNTLACNAFDTSIGRMVDQIYDVMNELDIMRETQKSVKKRIESCDPNDTDGLAALTELYEQIGTEISLQNTVLTNTFGNAITVFQEAKNTLNVAVADHGARYSRMKMTQSQLDSLELDTNEAKSENENIDLEEVLVDYTEADMLYQAALQATVKIIGTSLLDFI